MRAKRVDGNHGEVRDHLRAVGWRIYDSSGFGRGFPDFVASRRGFTALVEVKDGSKVPSARKLTDAQEKFWKVWPGVKIVAKSPQDAERQLDLAEKYQYLRCAGYQA
jgi:hypothetical protein